MVVGICVGSEVGWPPVMVTTPRLRVGASMPEVDDWASAPELKGKATATAMATQDVRTVKHSENE
jgi:hypothetical protein